MTSRSASTVCGLVASEVMGEVGEFVGQVVGVQVLNAKTLGIWKVLLGDPAAPQTPP